jgi:tetratricopeptide (TPR) repeat protein
MNLLRCFVSLLALLAASLAFAADESSSPPPSPAKKTEAPVDPLASARALIQQERWRDAITELKRINLAQSADWNNLMGYSHRKAKTPDYAAAQQHYDSALRIDPQHRGALEYSGELALMKNDLPTAQSRLASLDKVCGKSCAEFTQLKAAIASFEAGTYPVAAR